MSDAPQVPDEGPTREAETGRYVRRHGAQEEASADNSADTPADTPAPAEAAAAPAAATPSGTPDAEAAADAPDGGTPPAAQSGGDTTPPAAPPPAEPGEEKDGKKRWMLLLLLLLILLALLCAGFSYMTWWRKDGPKDAQPATSPTVASTSTAGTSGPSPSLTITPNPSPTPTPTPSPTASVKLINVPNVVGMPAADAKVILEGAGFTEIQFVSEANPGTDLSVLVSYTVTKQSVAAGTQVPADTTLVITCTPTSNGKG